MSNAISESNENWAAVLTKSIVVIIWRKTAGRDDCRMPEKLNRTNPKGEGTKDFEATEVTDTWTPELSCLEDYQIWPDFTRSFRKCMVWKLSRVKCMWEILCQSRLSKVVYFRNYQDFHFMNTEMSGWAHGVPVRGDEEAVNLIAHSNNVNWKSTWRRPWEITLPCRRIEFRSPALM